LPEPSPAFVPSRRTYARLGAPAPMGASVPLEGRDPRTLLERLAPSRFPFLLESARTGAGPSRYSFLGGDPVLRLRTAPEGVRLERARGPEATLPMGPLKAIRTVLDPWRAARPRGIPPFFGGLVGVFAYDLARRFERLPVRAVDDLGLPDVDLSLVDTVVAVDHRDDRLWVTWLPDPEARRRLGPEALYDAGRERVEALLARLGTAAPTRAQACAAPGPVTAGMTREAFTGMVRRAKAYIAQGDIFQANLSQRFACPVPGVDPWRLYCTLTAINPSPFACYLERDDYRVVSSSPERLVAVEGGTVQVRPIAGTRPRGRDAGRDRARGRDLLSSPKERAEHVMLVDLMRNDLGRVCDYGSVRVSEFMTTERYSHVMHIVSNVVGRLGPGMDAPAVLRAVFPGGTITGAPKVRCMEVIEELEPVRRGLYTGSAGYLSAAGDMDLNLLIRTLVLKGDTAWFQTGAGIVADSDPEREHAETLHKAEAMRRALEAVGQGAPPPALTAART